MAIITDVITDLVTLLSTIQATGFTELQAKAYISSLKIGEASGSAIAEDAGINRSKIYDTLKKLEEMGAVAKLSRENKTTYIAKEPEHVLNNILKKFSQRLQIGKDKLNDLKGTFTYLDEKVATLNTIDLDDFDVNQYNILISSDERTRTKFVEKLNVNLKPKEEVLLLNLNIEVPPEFLLLLSHDEMLFFNNSPGRVLENVLKLSGNPISKFFHAIVESSWENDFPTEVFLDIESGKLRAVYTGKALWITHTNIDGLVRKEHSRPVGLLITDTHISFFFEGIEDPKIPISSISNIMVEEGNLVICELANIKTGQSLGKLKFRVIAKANLIRNIISVISNQIR